MKFCFKRYIYALLSFYFLAHPGDINAVTHPSIPESNREVMSRIVSITTHESKSGTTVNVLGDGKISEYNTGTLNFPQRIFIDIFCDARSLGIVTIVEENTILKNIRVGYHAKKIRLVLDIKGSDMPVFTTKSVNNELIISLQMEEKMDKEQGKPNKANSNGAGKEISESKKPENMQEGDNRQDAALPDKENQSVDKEASVNPGIQGNEVEITEHETENVLKERDSLGEDDTKKPVLGEKLTQTVTDDGREDTAIFLQCLGTYMAQDWSGTIENLNHLIKTYPEGRYTERAYFLLAKSYDKLNSQSISDHFKKTKNHYEDAINRYPESEHAHDALLGIGDLYFEIKNYHEALGYYNLVLKKDKDSILAVKALIRKVNVLLLRKNKEDALSALTVLEDLTSMSPDLPERLEARKLKAKILYETNRFRESLNILTELKKANSENIYKHPEISLYLGYNYYQLGDNVRSRQNLFRFYNSCPGREMKHIILTQIGDTYLNEKLTKDAVKIFQMVIKRYPNTEGAIISSIRLAEQQEEWNIGEKINKEVGSPKKIYEDIVNNSLSEKKKDPLVQLAMLKLAISYQKENKYKESLKVLKALIVKYPMTSMQKELKHALLMTFDGTLKEKVENKRYTNIINFYFQEEKLISMVNAPELFLTVARAFKNRDFEDTATEIYKKADPLLPDKEKPSDLLFILGKVFFEQEKLNSALSRLSLLIDNYPSDKYVPYAYRLKGSIFLKQKKYHQATDMFSEALKYTATKCKRAELLINKAKALTQCNLNENALKALKDADDLKIDCGLTDYYIYQDMGDLYLHHGYAKKAVTLFNRAVDMTKEKGAKISLKFKVAQCYLLLNRTEDSLALYKQVSSLNDPFWSNLAQEKIKEINFSRVKIPEMLN